MTTFNTLTTRVRVYSFLLAVLTSTLVLGGTVAMMGSGDVHGELAMASMPAQAAIQPLTAVN
jgi:hypothetical protein